MGPLKECKKQKKQTNKLAILGHSRVNPTVRRHAPKATGSHNCKAVYTANPGCGAHRGAFNEETWGICMNPVRGALQLTLGSTLEENTLVHLTACWRSPLHWYEWWSGGCAVEGETLSECGTINRKTEGGTYPSTQAVALAASWQRTRNKMPLSSLIPCGCQTHWIMCS